MLEPERLTRAQRELRALVREVGSNDPEALAELVGLAEWLRHEGLPAAAGEQVARGYSWADVARPLGISRQAAWARFGAAGAPSRVG